MMPADSMLAALSHIAYLDQAEQADAQAGSLGWDILWRGDHADTQGLLCRDRQTAAEVIVFRGTEFSDGSLSDIISNIGRPVRWSGPGQVHSGYLRHFERLAYPLAAVLEERPVAPILCGHSLGGAVATLAALWLGAVVQIAPKALVTFGAPRSLNRAACEALISQGTPVRRYRIAGDLASFCPPLFFSAAALLRHPGQAEILPNERRWMGPFARHDIYHYMTQLEAAEA